MILFISGILNVCECDCCVVFYLLLLLLWVMYILFSTYTVEEIIGVAFDCLLSYVVIGESKIILKEGID